MARIRSLKPEFWVDRKLARKLSRDARMLYLGLWNLADEHARALGDPQYVKGQIFPYDDDLDSSEIAGLLGELADAGVVVPYEVDEDPYLFLPNLHKHQRLEPQKVASRYPAPPCVDPAQSRANESAPNPDEVAPDAGSSALLYVAGSMEHVAGSMVTRDAQTTPPLPPDVDNLRDRLAAVRLEVRWDKLDETEVAEVAALVEAHGPDRLVKAAQQAWRKDDPPQYANAWLGIWRSLRTTKRSRAEKCPVHRQEQPCSGCAADAKAVAS